MRFSHLERESKRERERGCECLCKSVCGLCVVCEMGRRKYRADERYREREREREFDGFCLLEKMTHRDTET